MKLVTPLGIPSIFDIGFPVLGSYKNTVLSLKEARKKRSQGDNLAVLGKALLRMTSEIS